MSAHDAGFLLLSLFTIPTSFPLSPRFLLQSKSIDDAYSYSGANQTKIRVVISLYGCCLMIVSRHATSMPSPPGPHLNVWKEKRVAVKWLLTGLKAWESVSSHNQIVIAQGLLLTWPGRSISSYLAAGGSTIRRTSTFSPVWSLFVCGLSLGFTILLTVVKKKKIITLKFRLLNFIIKLFW